MGASFIFKAVFVFAALCFVAVSAKQAVPFDPIHPGSIHADRFSPLNGDRVTVDPFVANQGLSAFVLDFASLTAKTEVNIDLKGGANFNNFNFEAGGNGPVSVGATTNDLNIEAFRGAFRFASNDLSISGGDTTFESLTGEVYAGISGPASLRTSGLYVSGDYQLGGVIFSSGGSTTFTAGDAFSDRYNASTFFRNGTNNLFPEDDPRFLADLLAMKGNIRFSATNFEVNGEDGLVITKNVGGGNLVLTAAQSLDMISEGAMNISASNTMRVLALSGPMDVEAGQFDIQTPFLFYQADGSLSMASVLGRMDISGRTGANVETADQAKFLSNENGIVMQAGNEVNFLAGDYIDLSSSSNENQTSTATFTGNNLRVESQLNDVSVDVTGNYKSTVSGNTQIQAGRDLELTAQDSFTAETSNSLAFNIQRNFIMSADNRMNFNGRSGAINFDINDDMFIVTEESAVISGEGLIFNVIDDAIFEVQTDLTFEADESISQTFNNLGVYSGEAQLNITSGGASTIAASDINWQSGDSVRIRAADLTVTTQQGDVTIDSPTFGLYRAKDSLVQGTGSMEILSRGMWSTEAPNFFTVNADANIEILADRDGDLYATSSSANSTNDFEFRTSRDLQLFLLDELTVQNNAATGTTTFTSGDNTRLESGDFLAQGNNLEMNANDLYIFARRGFDFGSSGPITIDASDLAGFVASGDLNVNSGDAANFTAVDDISISSTDGFFGDIIVRSTQGDLRVDVADTTTLFTDRFEVYGGDSIAFQSKSFNLRHTENDPSDYGNFNFTSVDGTLGHRAKDLYVIDARSVEMSGANVNMNSATKLTINAASNGNIDVESVGPVALTAAQDISMSSGVIRFLGRNQGQLTAAEWNFASDDLFINGTDAFSIKSLDDVNFVVDNAFGTLLEDAFSFTAGFVSVLADEDLTLYEGGGGTRINAGKSYIFTAGDIVANAQERIAFVSKQGSMSVNANNVLTFEGGDQTLTAGTNIDFLSNNGVFSASSSDNGYISFNSAKSIISTAAETFTLSPNSPLLASNQGRYGTIRATPENGNICINTDGTEDNSFNGDSVTFTATDPQGANMTVDAGKDMLFLTEDGSIGINAYGFIPTDPQFIFEPSVTFGILFRTNEENFNPIFMSADNANIFGFARGKVDIRSVAGGLEALAGVDTDIRTFGRDADIIVVAGDDNSIEYFAGGDMTLRAGNDRLNADFKIDSTGDMTFTAEENVNLEHVGLTTDPDYRGIYFTTKGDYLMTAEGGDYDVRALQGGVVDFRTREGDMVFNAILGSINLSALTGRISNFARGSAVFDTVGGPVNIFAQGDSGSVYVSSGSDELFSINTDSTMSFTSLKGEVDVESSEDFRTTSVGNTAFNSFCTNVEGGSVRFIAEDLVQFTSNQDIAFDAQVEYTVDADFITYQADQTFRLSAGGSDATPGIIATSVGAITYTSNQDEITFNATNFVVTAAQDVLLSYANDAIFYSKLDSITEDNIVLTSENGPTLVTADAIRKDATFTQQTSSANMLATVATDITLLSNRLLRWDTAETWTNTVTNTYTVSGGDLDADFDDVFVITSTVGDILFDADALLQMDVTGTYTYDATNLKVTTRGSDALVAWNSVDDFTATETGTFTSTVGGDTQVYAANDITLSALVNFNVNTYDDLRVFSIQDVDFNAVNGLYDGKAESFEFYSDDFVFTASQLTVSTVRFGVNAYESVDIGQNNAFAFVLTGAVDQNARFLAEGDIQMISATQQSLTATDRLLFESESDDGPFTVTASNNLISTPGTSLSVTSRRNTFVNSATLNDIDFTTGTFTAKGPGSVNFVATFLPITVSAGNTLFESLNGNIILEQTQAATDFEISSTAASISVTTTDEEGDILLSSGEGDTAFTAQNFLIQQVDPDLANDSTRSGTGLISFSGETVTFGASSFLTLNAEDNIEASSRRGITTYSGATVVLSAGQVVNLEAQNSLTMDSGAGPTDFEASGTGFSLIRGHSNDITLRADGKITYTSSVEFEARSLGSMSLTGTTAAGAITVDGAHSHMTAQDEDFRLTATAFTWINTPFIIMEATGPESLFDLHPTTLALTATNTYIRADETFSGVFTNVVSTTTFESTSAHDTNFVVQNNGVITFTGGNINFRAIDDGNVIANIAGDMLTRSTAADINFRAEGMLGALGGRYVLEDQYWLPQTTLDNRHRINRNTFGIEVTNNDGDVNLIATNVVGIFADQGSVELRATAAIRYRAPNPTGNIRFFGIGATTNIPGIPIPPGSPASGGPAAGPYIGGRYAIPDSLNSFGGAPMLRANGFGQLPRVPFNRLTDYCTGRQCTLNGSPFCNVTCPNISRVINEIASALVRYGLLDCRDAASGFCIV